MSITENLLKIILEGGNIENYEPQSEMEYWLKNIALGIKDYEKEPNSRITALLKEISNNKTGGSSGGEQTRSLKKLLDNTKSAENLFKEFEGDSIEGILEFNDTEKVELIDNMFENCENLKNIPLFNTSNVTSADYAFSNCSSITTIPDFDFSKVTSTQGLFYGCSKLKTISALNLSKSNFFSQIFNKCSSLKTVLVYGIRLNFDISASTQFEASDLVTLMSNCPVVTVSRKLTMGTTNLAKLDGVYVKETGVEPYAGITVRPCVICESTDEGAMLATDYFTGKGWTLA